MTLTALVQELALTLSLPPLAAVSLISLVGGFLLGRFSQKRAIPQEHHHSPLALSTRQESSVRTQTIVSSRSGNISLSNMRTSIALDQKLFAELSEMIRMGKKLEAIRYLRERKLTQLRDAKEMVEMIEMNMDTISNLHNSKQL